MLKKLNQTGDTIVEVLLVLAILGLALGISYETANRSLLNIRQAQENSQATELVSSQIESIIGLNASNPNALFNNPIVTAGAFCIPFNGTVPSNTPTDCQNNYGSYPAGYTISDYYCGPVANGGPLTLPSQCTALDTSGRNSTFVVIAQWDDIVGQGQDTVTMDYRVYEQ